MPQWGIEASSGGGGGKDVPQAACVFVYSNELFDCFCRARFLKAFLADASWAYTDAPRCPIFPNSLTEWHAISFGGGPGPCLNGLREYLTGNNEGVYRVRIAGLHHVP